MGLTLLTLSKTLKLFLFNVSWVTVVTHRLTTVTDYLCSVINHTEDTAVRPNSASWR